MKNKCFIFMIILFSIFMPSFIANAESYNIDNYDDLINAINNDDTNKLIKLTSDINVTKENGMTIKNGQEVTLELNGHVLSLNATNTSTTYLLKKKINNNI